MTWRCRMYDKRSRWVKVNVISVVLVTINALCCVIVGLIVWYRYNPTPLRTNDNNKYAIIGALQLWMILVTVAAVLFTEVSQNTRYLNRAPVSQLQNV